MEFIRFNLQMFADAGTLVNATGNYVNAGTGATTAFEGANTLSPELKDFYDTELLENARAELIFAQFGRKQPLPANKGRTVEWRKWNTLPNADVLQEGVIPSGEKLGQTTLTTSLEQYGMFVAITDILDLHAIDNVLLGATEELGASAAESKDILIRNVLQAGTAVMYADKVAADGSKTEVVAYSGMDPDNCRLTPDMVAKAATHLKKMKAPTINGKYVAVVHPSVTYDLRSSDEWIEAHKYAATTEIFNGEIGELHGCRFVENVFAPVMDGEYENKAGTVTYATYLFGKDSFGIIDPEGGALQMIIHDKGEIGGPLNQFSTIGTKFSMAAKILYPERLLTLESLSSYSAIDEAN